MIIFNKIIKIHRKNVDFNKKNNLTTIYCKTKIWKTIKHRLNTMYAT